MPIGVMDGSLELSFLGLGDMVCIQSQSVFGRGLFQGTVTFRCWCFIIIIIWGRTLGFVYVFQEAPVQERVGWVPR